MSRLPTVLLRIEKAKFRTAIAEFRCAIDGDKEKALACMEKIKKLFDADSYLKSESFLQTANFFEKVNARNFEKDAQKMLKRMEASLIKKGWITDAIE